MQGNSPSTPTLLLTPQQAAEALGISPRKLWSMSAANEVPHVRFGRSVRYPVASLQKMIADMTQGGSE